MYRRRPDRRTVPQGALTFTTATLPIAARQIQASSSCTVWLSSIPTGPRRARAFFLHPERPGDRSVAGKGAIVAARSRNAKRALRSEARRCMPAGRHAGGRGNPFRAAQTWRAPSVRRRDECPFRRVSRVVVREVVKTLTAKGLVVSKTKVGTIVRGAAAWNWLDAEVLEWRVRAGLDGDFLEQITAVTPGDRAPGRRAGGAQPQQGRYRQFAPLPPGDARGGRRYCALSGSRPGLSPRHRHGFGQSAGPFLRRGDQGGA